MSKFNRYKRSAGRFLRKIFRRPKAEINRGSVMIMVALSIIFISALTLRLEPLINAQPVVRAFDPWFQLRVTEYVTENGYAAYFSWYDYTTWVPFGRDMTQTSYIGVPFTTAFFYWVVNLLGIEVSVTYVALIVPAFMGALTTIVAFFLGRELYNNTVGMLNSLFMAFMPAFIQRTVVGFFDNESIGIFAIVLTMYLFIRSIRRESSLSGVAAGLSLGYLLASWGAADFMLGLFALYGFTMLIIGRYSKRLLTTFLLTLTLGMFIGCLVPRNGFESLTSFTYLAPIGVGVLLTGYEIWQRIGSLREATAIKIAPHLKSILVGIITPIAGMIAYVMYSSGLDLSIVTTASNPFTVIGNKFLSVINPFFRLDQRIFASVAEHLPSPWGSFYQTLLILIFFLPLGMYFLFRRGRDEDYLLLLFGITAVYFAGSMIRLSLILAPAAAILASIAVNGILSPFAKVVTQDSVFERRRFRMSSSLTSEHAIAAFGFVGLLLSVNLIMGVSYVTNSVSNPEFAPSQITSDQQFGDWQTSMNYIRNVLPDDAVIASWWDYGYWINGAGEGQTIVDNATWNRTQIALMGYALMALNFTESLKTFKLWNTTHVLVYWGHTSSGVGGDEGKWPWMVRIAEDRFGSSVIDDATYLGDNPATDQEESEYTQDAFFQSTLYKLMMYNEPTSLESGQQRGLTNERLGWDRQYIENPDKRWVNNIPQTLHGAFKEAFISYAYGFVKIYEIDYTMLEQYNNRTSSDWRLEKDSLSQVSIDGSLSPQEEDFQSFDTVFGGGYDATVYTRANSTHVYYGIQMDNYTLAEDAFGLQISPIDSTSVSDIRAVNYQGKEYFDGHIDYYGDWVADAQGANESEAATGENVIEFLLPLNSEDPDDIPLSPGNKYQIRFLFWNNIQTGEPTLNSDWTVFWVPVELH